MLKVFLVTFMLVIMMSLSAQEVEGYDNEEDHMLDPKISATEQKKVKRQVGEANHEAISADHVIAGDRFDEIPEGDDSSATGLSSSGAGSSNR